MLICDLFLTCSKVGQPLSSSHVKPRQPSANTKRVVCFLRQKCPFATTETPQRVLPAAAPAPGSPVPRALTFELRNFSRTPPRLRQVRPVINTRLQCERKKIAERGQVDFSTRFLDLEARVWHPAIAVL